MIGERGGGGGRALNIGPKATENIWLICFVFEKFNTSSLNYDDDTD